MQASDIEVLQAIFKHLPGQHNQKKHAGSLKKYNFKALDPDGEEAAPYIDFVANSLFDSMQSAYPDITKTSVFQDEQSGNIIFEARLADDSRILTAVNIVNQALEISTGIKSLANDQIELDDAGEEVYVIDVAVEANKVKGIFDRINAIRDKLSATPVYEAGAIKKPTQVSAKYPDWGDEELKHLPGQHNQLKHGRAELTEERRAQLREYGRRGGKVRGAQMTREQMQAMRKLVKPESLSASGKLGYEAIVAKYGEGYAARKFADYRRLHPTANVRRICSFLENSKVKYELEKELINNVFADIVLPDQKLVIECDEEIWHRPDPLHGEDRSGKDRNKVRVAKRLGYSVLRLTGTSIRNGTALAAIDRRLQVQKHLPGEHNQLLHANKHDNYNRTLNGIEGRHVGKNIYELRKITDPETFIKLDPSIVFYTGTNTMYVTTRHHADVETHIESIENKPDHPDGYAWSAGDESVRVWFNDDAGKGLNAVLEGSTFGATRAGYEDPDVGITLIHDVFNRLRRMGLPKGIKTSIKYATVEKPGYAFLDGEL